MHRIAIIGGGPAGSVAGLLLARGGLDVTIIEQHRFPRDKVCGECLSALGIAALGDIGLADHIERELRPITLRRTILHSADGGSIALGLPSPMWGVSRGRFDTFLLDAAINAGAVLRQPARCERVNDGTVHIRWLHGGEIETIEADLVILADGKSALAADRPAPSGDFGVKSHWRDINRQPADAIELFGVNGHYGGIAPIETGESNISFSVPAERIRAFGGDLDVLFSAMTQENAALKSRLRGARRVGPWHASPLPRFGVRSRWPDRVIPVGNAAAAIEPIGGEGMGLAIRSAQLAAGAILAAARQQSEIDIAALRRQYRSLWNARRVACRLFAQILSRPSLAPAVVALAESSPALPRLALQLIGK